MKKQSLSALAAAGEASQVGARHEDDIHAFQTGDFVDDLDPRMNVRTVCWMAMRCVRRVR